MAFNVDWRDMCSESDTLERCSRSSRFESVSWERERTACGFECGRSSRVDVMSGRRVSIVSGSGMMARGPEKEAVREVSVRDWWVRWVVSAS